MVATYASRVRHESSPPILTPDDKLVLATDLQSINAALDAGADPQGSPNVAFPPLFYSIEQKLDAGVDLLLAHGANPDGMGDFHPLNFAAGMGNLYAIQTLLQHGANPDARNRSGQTSLHILASRPELNPQLTSILLAAGANPNLPNKQGHSPLAIARQTGNREVARLLLAAIAQANIAEIPPPPRIP